MGSFLSFCVFFLSHKSNFAVCHIFLSINYTKIPLYNESNSSSTAVNRLAQKQVTSLITLGTPHISPSSALVDQTRGLLRAIAESPSCSSESLSSRGIDITCVG